MCLGYNARWKIPWCAYLGLATWLGLPGLLGLLAAGLGLAGRVGLLDLLTLG